MTKKIELGQFFTKKDLWLKPHIQQFINSVKFDKIVDPFAGGGHLLKVFSPLHKTAGYDIDSTLSWPINDGLVSIPDHSNDLCVTNPPYLAKTTAVRFKRDGTIKYFDQFPQFDDLYLMGLEQCLKSFPNGVAIIPETYQLHPKKTKRLISLTVLEENAFDDTDFPVVIICWGPEDREDYDIYKNEKLVGTNNLLNAKLPTKKNLSKDLVKFNDINGNLGIVCIDRGDLIGGIKFTESSNIKGPIKHSSRTSTRVMVTTSVDLTQLIDECNIILKQYRTDTLDVFMAPFKGNDNQGLRRRRLDFTTARLIIENALVRLNPAVGEINPKKSKQVKFANPDLITEAV